MADKKVKEVSEPLKKPVSRKKKVDVAEEKVTKKKVISADEKVVKKKKIDEGEKVVKKKKTDVEGEVLKTKAEVIKSVEKEVDVKEKKAVVLNNDSLTNNYTSTKDSILYSKDNVISVRKTRDSKLPYIILVIAIILAAVLLYFITRKMGLINPTISVDSSVTATSVSKESTKKETVIENKKTVKNTDEIRNKLNIDIREPKNAKDVEYSIQGEDVACITYIKSYVDDDGSEADMNFVMKSSFSQEDNMAGVEYQWGTPIIMTVICDDASEVEVRSNVAIEDNAIMKAEWMDNSLYYTMTTSSLFTREEFLQEVNRVIIANHIEF